MRIIPLTFQFGSLFSLTHGRKVLLSVLASQASRSNYCRIRDHHDMLLKYTEKLLFSSVPWTHVHQVDTFTLPKAARRTLKCAREEQNSQVSSSWTYHKRFSTSFRDFTSLFTYPATVLLRRNMATVYFVDGILSLAGRVEVILSSPFVICWNIHYRALANDCFSITHRVTQFVILQLLPLDSQIRCKQCRIYLLCTLNVLK